MDMNSTSAAPAQEISIRRFIRRVGFLIGLRYSLLLITGWGFASGVAVLALRAAAGRLGIHWSWIVTGVIPCVIIATVMTFRRLPDRSAVRAMLDSRNSCGGLLMASEHSELGDWQSRLPAIVEPRIRWRSRRALALAFGALVFVSFSLLVPDHRGLASDKPLDIAKQIEDISSDIDVLKKEEIIDVTQAESLEEKLESISADAKGEDPAKTWEALDHLQDSVAKTAKEAAEKMAQANERLGEAQALSEALAEGAAGMDSKLVTEAMKELQSQMKAAADNRGNAPTISNELAKALKSGSLSKEQLKQIAEALKQQKLEASKRLGKLRESGMIDPQTLRQCEKAGQCDSSGLAKFLKDNAATESVSEMMGSWGKGGVDRGRGDAPMTWGDKSSDRGAKFKEQVLPSSLSGLKDSQLIGRSTGAPEVEKNGRQGSGALRDASAGGGSAYTQTILPRHRGAVNRYFERR
jgi:hypothetical protein